MRPRIIGAVSALVFLGACSSATSTTSTTSAPTTQLPGTTATPAAAPTTTFPAPTAPADPAALLASALAQYNDGYEFTATTTVNDVVASVQTGRWVGGGSQMIVTSGDAEIEYLVTADGQWTRIGDGIWEVLDGTPPVDFPLAALATPTSLSLGDDDGQQVQVLATYPAGAVGLTGDPVVVELMFLAGTLVEASFTTVVDDNTASSVTELRPLTDATPVTSPPS